MVSRGMAAGLVALVLLALLMLFMVETAPTRKEYVPGLRHAWHSIAPVIFQTQDSGGRIDELSAKPRVAVFTLVRRASLARWETLVPWCQEVSAMDLFVTTEDDGFGSSAPAKNLQAACKGRLTLHATTQPSTLPPDRVERLALLRDLQREHARLMLHVSHADAVVVLDMDVYSVPSWSVMLAAIERIQRSQVDVLCANGFEVLLGGMRRYYDIFALVYADGSWGFPSNVALGVWKEFTFQLFRFYRAICASQPATYEVRSCFGGMAVYNSSIWFAPGCSYSQSAASHGLDQATLSRYAEPGSGNVCEHVIFHECLHSNAGSGSRRVRVAIDPNLLVQRDPDEVERVGPVVVIAIYVLSFLGVICWGVVALVRAKGGIHARRQLNRVTSLGVSKASD